MKKPRGACLFWIFTPLKKYTNEVIIVWHKPNWIAYSRKDAPTYRFLDIREPLRPLELSLEEKRELPFPTAEFEQKGRYKLFGVVTNRLEVPGDEIIEWHRKRC